MWLEKRQQKDSLDCALSYFCDTTMNRLSPETLCNIFTYVDNPFAWSLVNKSFLQVARDPITIAEWSLVQFDSWRAFDRMIGNYARILTPNVVMSMVAKGARLPRFVAQAVLKRRIPGLSSRTAGALLNCVHEKYDGWELGVSDWTMMDHFGRKALIAGTTGDTSKQLSSELNTFLQRTGFYPIRPTFSVIGPKYSHDLILITLLIHARPWMKALIRQGFRLRENDILLEEFPYIAMPFKQETIASCLSFLVTEKAFLKPAEQFERILSRAILYGDTHTGEILLKVETTLPVDTLVHNAIRSTIIEQHWRAPCDHLLLPLYRRFPAPDVLDEALSSRYDTALENDDLYVSPFDPATLRYFLEELRWSPHRRGAQYLLESNIRGIKIARPATFDRIRLVEECVMKHGFPLYSRYDDLVHSRAEPDVYNEFHEAFIRMGVPLMEK